VRFVELTVSLSGAKRRARISAARMRARSSLRPGNSDVGALDADRRYANRDEATCGDHTAASGRKAEEPSRQARNTLDEIFVQVQRVSEVIRSSNYSVDEAGARTGRVEA